MALWPGTSSCFATAGECLCRCLHPGGEGQERRESGCISARPRNGSLGYRRYRRWSPRLLARRGTKPCSASQASARCRLGPRSLGTYTRPHPHTGGCARWRRSCHMDCREGWLRCRGWCNGTPGVPRGCLGHEGSPFLCPPRSCTSSRPEGRIATGVWNTRPGRHTCCAARQPWLVCQACILWLSAWGCAGRCNRRRV